MNIQLPLDRWNDPYYIAELTKNRWLVSDFSRLTNCHQDIIVEAMKLRQATWKIIPVRWKDEVNRDVLFDGGYNLFQVEKSDGTYRTISAPAPVLKIVQWDIKNYLLSQVETYSWAIWGERGKSFVDNAKSHISNSRGYLVNMDLANAYPSVWAKRLFVNLKSALRKKIDISFPDIKEEKRVEIIDMLVILMMNNNELPQWASTSMKALNIVMARSDQEILRFLETEIWDLLNIRYSRYVDDLSISWREFWDMRPVWSLRREILKLLTQISENQKTTRSIEDIIKYIYQIDEYLDMYESIDFSFNTREQRRHLIQLFQEIQDILDGFNEVITQSSQVSEIQKLNTLKQRIKNYRHEVEQNKAINDGIQVIQRWVRKILIDQWWVVKDKKTRMWTPASSHQKIITGVSLSKTWELWIPKEKEKEIREFLIRAIHYAHTLPEDYTNNPKKIARAIIGYKNFIIHIRGKMNAEIGRLFREAKALYFPDGSDIENELWYRSFSYNGS